MHDGFLGEGDLLDDSGNLIESGYAFSQVKRYDRGAIKHNKLRVKERDYYCFCDDRYAVALTVEDNSLVSLGSVSVVDFAHIKCTTKRKIGFKPKGRLGLPPSCSDGDIVYDRRGVEIEFRLSGSGERTLSCEFKSFDGKKDFECEIALEPSKGDNITVAVPFEKKRRFYYSTKVNCLKGKGWFAVGEDRYDFNGGYGVLDWSRGVCPKKNTRYWSSLSCELDGKPFGLNLGYGLGTPRKSENVIFYDGKAHKLENVKFDIPYTQGKIDFLKPWKMADEHGRLELMFYPIVDLKDKIRGLRMSTDRRQVFGRFYGKVTLDDGTLLSVADKIGFAEKVINKR